MEPQQVSHKVGTASGDAGALCTAAGDRFLPQIKTARLAGSEFRSLSPHALCSERTPSQEPGAHVLSDQNLLQKQGPGSAQRPDCKSEGGKLGAIPRASVPCLAFRWEEIPRVGPGVRAEDRGPSRVCLLRVFH